MLTYQGLKNQCSDFCDCCSPKGEYESLCIENTCFSSRVDNVFSNASLK